MVGAGDSVIFYNYRGDRPRELVKAFVYEPFPRYDLLLTLGALTLLGLALLPGRFARRRPDGSSHVTHEPDAEPSGAGT